MHTVKVPKRINNTRESFEELMQLYDKVSNLKNTKVIFDFSDTGFFEANLCAVLGAIFEILFSNNNEIVISNIPSGIKKILQKNGFLSYFGLEKCEDVYKTTVKFAVFDRSEKLFFQSYLNDELFPKISINMDDEFKNYLCSNLDEVYQNARVHGETEKIFVCGQWYPNDAKVKFTVVDLGVSIFENVKKVVKNVTPCAAIEWATQEGNTTRKGGVGGRGLHDLSSFIRKNGGKMHIISNSGYWGNREKRKGYLEFETVFPGTIVNLEINLKDKNIYIYKWEEWFSEDVGSLLDIFME